MLNSKVLLMAGMFGTVLPVMAQGMPGTVEYLEGQAAVGGTPVTQQSVGSLAVQAGQMVSTGNGTVAVELLPGVVLRLDKVSAVKMVAVDGKRSEVLVQSGRAEVEIAEYSGTHDVLVDTANGVQTTLLKHGLYNFDAKAGQLRVLEGKAAVSEWADAKWVEVKEQQEIALNGSATKAVDFDGGRGYGAGGGSGYGNEFAGGYGAPYGYGFGPGLGFYEPYPIGFYPGYYGGFDPGFYGGFGFGYGGFYRGGGGFRGRLR